MICHLPLRRRASDWNAVAYRPARTITKCGQYALDALHTSDLPSATVADNCDLEAPTNSGIDSYVSSLTSSGNCLY
jgi:hypothetical protein